ncbi:MAG: hypothetical protein AAFY69_10670 [Pseudomonadota bacterium]
MTRTLLLLTLLTLLAGCASPVSTTARPDDYYASVDTGPAGGSLFAGDARTLSDDSIQRILNYRYEPPALSRIALMPFGREVWSRWSEELAVAAANMETEVLNGLRASPRVYDASYLPSILVPKKHTVPYLREAAARYQADLLLVYRSYCRSFDRYRLFRADESRAYCGVEAVLLDTRTGLVPFTTVATRAYTISRDKNDNNFSETRMRAQLDATAQALGDVSDEIVGFLGVGDTPTVGQVRPAIRF